MKTRIYLRIAKNKYGNIKVASSTKPDFRALNNGCSYRTKYFPTVLYALDLEVPDSAFSGADRILQLKLDEGLPATKISQGEIKDEARS